MTINYTILSQHQPTYHTINEAAGNSDSISSLVSAAIIMREHSDDIRGWLEWNDVVYNNYGSKGQVDRHLCLVHHHLRSQLLSLPIHPPLCRRSNPSHTQSPILCCLILPMFLFILALLCISYYKSIFHPPGHSNYHAVSYLLGRTYTSMTNSKTSKPVPAKKINSKRFGERTVDQAKSTCTDLQHSEKR